MTTAPYTDRTVRVGALDLHYQEWGDPSLPPLIMLHGFGVSGHMFDEFAGKAGDRYHLLALDQRGHGDSAWAEDGDYSRDSFIADLEGFRAELGIERFILMGHSMGGLNSAAYTAKYPGHVEALVLVDVGPEAAKEGVDNIMRFTRGPDELEFEEFVQLAHQFNQRRTIENIRERMRHRLKQMPSGKWTWKFDARFRKPDSGLRIGSEMSSDDTWEMFRAITPPVLLVRGGESDVLKAETAERCIREMHRARLVTVPGAGHSVPGDNPEEFTAAVDAFLDDVAAGKFEPFVEASLPPLTALVTEQDRAGRGRPGVLTLVLVSIGAAAALAGVVLAGKSASRRHASPAEPEPPAKQRRGRRRKQAPAEASSLIEEMDEVASRAMARAREAVADAQRAAGLPRKRRPARRAAGIGWKVVSFGPRRAIASRRK